MHPVDHLFIFLLFVAQPVYGLIEARRYDAREAAGLPFDRFRFYAETAVIEWAFLAVLLAAWIGFGRPLAGLGFVAPGGPGFWIGSAVLGLIVGYLLYGWRWALRAGDSERTAQIESIGKLIRYLPRTNRELGSFVGISLTAGIVEEIVYRGFALWYFGQFMPLWAAVVASSVAFGLGHSYQGPAGALRCATLGLGFALLYVGSGSIWLPIVAHFLLDALQGLAIRELTRPAAAGGQRATT